MTNIWATITHLSDAYFSGANDSGNSTLDLLICEGLHEITKKKQVWMVNPVWCVPGTSAILLRESYRELRDAVESYLLLVTPGFADVLNNVPTKLIERYLREICNRAKVFNKRIVMTLIGTPPNCPEEVAEKIKKVNEVTKAIAKDYNGSIVDLTDIKYESWTENGSRPSNLNEVSKRIIETILEGHSSISEWRILHGQE